MLIQVGSEQFCGWDQVPWALRSTPITAIIKQIKKVRTVKTGYAYNTIWCNT
ncbi:hypothetical protein [Cytobacillus praedii]|uniref:hypothetical protein n=1 Tax=Cytobacillus praedii TaxID=1742358 RepID=UPI002E24FCE0|nr:hypothetical protein [Cytobacillus praedii]